MKWWWIPLWAVQYLIWVPLVLLWHAFAFAFGLGLLGILLLVIPVLGWIVLIILLLGRGHHPWLADLLHPWALPH